MFDKSISTIKKNESFSASAYSTKTGKSKQYECHHCGVIYKNQGGLDYHLKKHANPYKCDKCGEEFVNKWAHIRHVKACTGGESMG